MWEWMLSLLLSLYGFAAWVLYWYRLVGSLDFFLSSKDQNLLNRRIWYHTFVRSIDIVWILKSLFIKFISSLYIIITTPPASILYYYTKQDIFNTQQPNTKDSHRAEPERHNRLSSFFPAAEQLESLELMPSSTKPWKRSQLLYSSF